FLCPVGELAEVRGGAPDGRTRGNDTRGIPPRCARALGRFHVRYSIRLGRCRFLVSLVWLPPERADMSVVAGARSELDLPYRGSHSDAGRPARCRIWDRLLGRFASLSRDGVRLGHRDDFGTGEAVARLPATRGRTRTVRPRFRCLYRPFADRNGNASPRSRRGISPCTKRTAL